MLELSCSDLRVRQARMLWRALEGCYRGKHLHGTLSGTLLAGAALQLLPHQLAMLMATPEPGDVGHRQLHRLVRLAHTRLAAYSIAPVAVSASALWQFSALTLYG